MAVNSTRFVRVQLVVPQTQLWPHQQFVAVSWGLQSSFNNYNFPHVINCFLPMWFLTSVHFSPILLATES